jgi:hypothetical protein
MSIQRVTPDDFETFTIETNPRRTYISSSTDGVTGSLYLFPRRSTYQKEPYPLNYYTKSYFSDYDLNQLRLNAITTSTGSTNITSEILAYMTGVQETPVSPKQYQRLEIIRFEPPFRFNSNTLRKLVTINTLMPYYRATYPNAHYSYTNYHCLNFYSASNVPTGSVLIYPNPVSSIDPIYRDYSFSGSFSFDFWIKPKLSPYQETIYKPGTIMHMSSAFAVSLCSGSSRDINGAVDGFRILLQLSSSTDIAPDLVTTSTPFTFFSNDNSLEANKWHHVTVRWGGPNYNFGSGSFIIDQQNQGYIVITSSVVAGLTSETQDILCIGNYYQGPNTGGSTTSWFFSTNTSLKDGLYELTSSTTRELPNSYSFKYPLKAEIHEIKMYNSYLNNDQITALNTTGLANVSSSSLKFYLPPFFTQESPYRQVVSDQGGVFETPFVAEDGTTIDPFNIKLAFGCGGHYINLENYVRDFVTGRNPRLLELSSSVITTPLATAVSANDLLYSSGSNIKRLYTILPNDNGKFYPNFDILSTYSGSKFVDDKGTSVLGYISLRDLITGSYPGTVIDSYYENSIAIELQGGNNPDTFWQGTSPGTDYAIYNRTRDNTSNQVVFFDISNMYYGMSIKPGTFVLTDDNISGSISGSISMLIKDDGYGNLYRADASSEHATWSSLGNIFYNEGIVLLKVPQLYFFGLNQFQCEFQGIQNVHVLTVNGYARPMQLITSSYAQFQNGEIDDLANETDKRYVFISNVLLHDDNLNVIGRTSIAQPVLKRSGDKFLFKIKMDY